MAGRKKAGVSRHRSRRKRKPPTPEPLVEKGFNEIVEALGIGVLGLSDEELREALIEPVAMVLGASKPSIQALIKRLQRNLSRVYQLIIIYMLEHRDKLSEEQLEFAVAYGDRVLLPYISRLYAEAESRGRDDLVAVLRGVWEKYGKTSPVRCPKCGFRAVDPGLTCRICGYILSEDEAKRQLGFNDLLVMVASTMPREMIEEMIADGAVYVTMRGVYPLRRARREEPGVVLELTPREKKMLDEYSKGGRNA